MSGTVGEILRREAKLNNFKKFVVDTPDTPIATAIDLYYGSVAKNSDKYNSLMRIGVIARNNPQTVTH